MKNTPSGIWINTQEIANLPTTGPAWDNLKSAADKPIDFPDLSNQDDLVNVKVMARGLVYARLHKEKYRDEVINACMLVMGTEKGGDTLALGRKLIAYVIATDLVGLPPEKDKKFRDWLHKMLTERFPDGKTLVSTHEKRPNNWGTHAGASRAAIASYLRDQGELERTAQVFRGWLGDRALYAGFIYKDPSWQVNPYRPLGINPRGATKFGHSIDGVLPDDQRRGGPFTWPPPKVNYVYTALQGAVAQAVILYRAGYDVWNWEDKAMLRAFKWLYNVANYPAEGNDTWLPHVINHYYGSNFPASVPAKPGKNVGWTDWTHGNRH